MFCNHCDTELTEDGSCPKCSLTDQYHEAPRNRKSRVRWSIEHSAAKLGCDWTEVPNAVNLAKEVGLSEVELSELVVSYAFRFRQPVFDLTSDEASAVARLSTSGLKVRRNDTGPFRQGFTIYKPIDVPGNSRPGDPWGIIDDDGETKSDAPIVWLYPTPDRKWIFCVSIYAGGPGPGDFDEEHDNLPDAAASVFDYFFGDPGKMTPPEVIERFKLYG